MGVDWDFAIHGYQRFEEAVKVISGYSNRILTFVMTLEMTTFTLFGGQILVCCAVLCIKNINFESVNIHTHFLDARIGGTCHFHCRFADRMYCA